MKKLLTACALVFLLSSCYTVKWNVGDGPQKNIKVVEKNHFVINGLAAIKTSDPEVMAGNAENYSVEVSHSFIDGLLSAITFGIYTPTTTTVTK